MKNYKAADFFNDYKELCHSHDRCCKCEIYKYFNYCPTNILLADENIIEVVYKWRLAQEKTFLQDLKEKFPSLDTTYILDNVCPSHFGYCEELEHNECMYISCEACWNRKI